jgi:hypothetical protein
MLNLVMLSVTNKPCLLSVIVLNVFMLSVVMLNVVAPYFFLQNKIPKLIETTLWQFKFQDSHQFGATTLNITTFSSVEQHVLDTNAGKQLS